jgi:membrane protease YdiL (CAAX protease family)
MGGARGWLPGAVYGTLGALGGFLSFWQRGAVFDAPRAPRFAHDPWLALAIGIALALFVTAATVRGTRWLVTRTRWARMLHQSLRAALLGATSRRLLLLAVGSACAEELLFRAALVPLLGVLGSALAFGALHVSGPDTYLGWMLWATLMGVVFSVLFLGSGSLWPAIVAHAAINYENMQYLCNYDPAAASSASVSPQCGRSRRL